MTLVVYEPWFIFKYTYYALYDVWSPMKVIEMPEHNQGDMGGTMRLGLRKTVFKEDEDCDICLYTLISIIHL